MLKKRTGFFLLLLCLISGLRLHAELALALVVSNGTHAEAWRLGNQKRVDQSSVQNKTVEVEEPMASSDVQQRGLNLSNSAQDSIVMGDKFFKLLNQANNATSGEDQIISCTKIETHYRFNILSNGWLEELKKFQEYMVLDDELFKFVCGKNNQDIRLYESSYKCSCGYYTILSCRADNSHYFFAFGAGETPDEAIKEAELHLKEQYNVYPDLRRLLCLQWEFFMYWDPKEEGYRLPYAFVQKPTKF